MAGKSFKGNLEVLNLSDIFQSLAMNRHSGTLIVHDGKREKKIFFAEGEITLLSTSKRMRLGDLLIASSKITEEDLNLALKLQKQSRKKLGEILVEEGFCEEDDIARLLRLQVEDELYDLFLWRKAEFEFLADQMPDDMAAESPNLTRLNINTNSLIMEALRRLDEWSLIQNLVPSTKEVFVVIDVDKFPDAEVPDRIKSDPEVIDGKTNVEGLAEKYLLSEFELCQHLAELVKRGAIQALNQEELAEKAEASYALNDFAGSAALYGRLSEYYPHEPKIMVPLADSMRRSGAEKQALALYEELATRLEGDGRDSDRLRQCYEAITQLDPTRLDLARKLENIELEMASAPTARSIVMPLLVVLALVVVGGLVFAFRDKIFKPPEVDTGDAAALLEKAKRAEAKGNYAEAFVSYNDLWDKYQGSKEFDKVELPIVVTTVPPGFDIYVNNIYQGSTKVAEPTLACKYSPANRVVVEVYSLEGKGRGESPLDTRAFADPHVFQRPQFVLYSRPLGSQITEAWLQDGLAYSKGLDCYLAPSRGGLLRVFKIESGTLLDGKPFDRKVKLGEQGDLFTTPQVVDGTFYVGTTDQGVLSLSVRDGNLPDHPKQLFPARFRVTGKPLVLAPGGPLSQGRVVFGTEGGEVLGYTLEGGTPVWPKRTTEGAIIGAALHLKDVALEGAPAGGAVFSCTDARVYCFSLLDGSEVWTYISPSPVQGEPLWFNDEILVPLVEGRVVALDPATGALKRLVFTEEKQQKVSLLSGRGVLYVATPDGRVRALGSDGEVKWEFKRPGEHSPRIALQNGRLLVAAGNAKVFALLPESGMVVWQVEFPEGEGFAVSPLSVNGEAFFVGTNKRFLHYCKVPK